MDEIQEISNNMTMLNKYGYDHEKSIFTITNNLFNGIL